MFQLRLNCNVTAITSLGDGDHGYYVTKYCKVSGVDRLFSEHRNFGQVSSFFMNRTPSTEKFVAWWGQMGSKWGVSRTVAQIHALFYLSRNPLNADDIATALEFSRSNVSAGLHELESWCLIKPVHIRGDRRQYFEAIKDPWEMFQVILDERKRREINPTVATLRTCLDELTVSERHDDPYTQERLLAMLEFFEVMIPLYDELRSLPRGPIQNLAKLTAKIRELIS
jgi:DNA-binding transcriptional regulator GbsR (MarR family)